MTTRFSALGVLFVCGLATASQAQLTNSQATPAEFPPASYAANQYIDSRGCVFIRAGIDGNVTWVPRVNRQRRQICGQTPSLSGRVAEAAAAPAPADAPEQITLETPAPAVEPTTQTAPKSPPPQTASAPAPRQAAPRPAPAPQRTAAVRPAPQPKPKPKPKPRVVAAPAPKPVAAPKPKPQVVAAAPAPAPAARPTVRRSTACSGLSPVSSRYVNSGADLPVRCGPQAVSPTAGAQVAAAPGARRVVVQQPQTAALQPGTRIVPRHVYTNRQNTGFQPVPQGYRRVWEDDRLNPRRAEQTVQGYQRTQLIWTDTVPRRLINQVTGQDVTASTPLVYPFTDINVQQRQLGTVTLVRRDGVLMKRVQRNTRAKPAATQPAPTLSTRSAPKPVAAPAPKPRASATTLQGQGMVQAALFRDAAGARAAAQRATRLGVPVRLGQVRRSGETLQAVMLGPFQTGDAQLGALRKAKAAGFPNARLR
ncbi:MAG: SPOR domain-containing protein [Pseudomonadota bacterium]